MGPGLFSARLKLWEGCQKKIWSALDRISPETEGEYRGLARQITDNLPAEI